MVFETFKSQLLLIIIIIIINLLILILFMTQEGVLWMLLIKTVLGFHVMNVSVMKNTQWLKS